MAISVATGAIAVASSSFVLGLYVQHENIRRNLRKIIQGNPYAFHIREKLITIFDDVNKEINQQADSDAPTRMEEIMKYGFPGLDDVRLYSDFVLSYDRRNRVAHWVFEHLRSHAIQNNPNVNRRNCFFHSDHDIPVQFRSTQADYYNSGYTRGHLAAAGNHKAAQSDCDQTFFFTNITPQIGRGFNWDAWNNLEQYVRRLVEHYDSVYVCTGPLYLPKIRDNGKAYVEYQMIGNNKVAVPTHFFKVLIVESKRPQGKPYMEAYVMPNANIDDSVNLRSFLADPDIIERASGLRFFDAIPRTELHGLNFRTEEELFNTFR